jgi:hypothetical protein
VILLYDVVEVCDLRQVTGICNSLFCLQFLEGLWIGGVFIDGNDPGSYSMKRAKRLGEKAFGGFCISGRTQEKLERVSWRIHGALEVHPHVLHLHIGLIDAPGIGRGLQMRRASLLQFGCVVLHESGGVDGKRGSVTRPFPTVPRRTVLAPFSASGSPVSDIHSVQQKRFRALPFLRYLSPVPLPPVSDITPII